MSIKEKERSKQKELIESIKKTDLYKTVMEYFPDAELIEVRPTIKDDDK
jgi:DNA polymerase-3 subunit gamma/tau